MLSDHICEQQVATCANIWSSQRSSQFIFSHSIHMCLCSHQYRYLDILRVTLFFHNLIVVFSRFWQKSILISICYQSVITFFLKVFSENMLVLSFTQSDVKMIHGFLVWETLGGKKLGTAGDGYLQFWKARWRQFAGPLQTL